MAASYREPRRGNLPAIWQGCGRSLDDIARAFTDSSLDSEIVRRFAEEFGARHWPWPNAPEIYYDPRSLSRDVAQRSSLHAKCVIAASSAALITSANFTEAAWLRNIEVGVLLRHEPTVRRLAAYYDGIIATGSLSRCSLPQSLPTGDS